jgi:ribosomal protein L3 glutamine methyltransferase
MNISQWIDQAEQEFIKAGLHYGHGTDNASDEAVWLVLHCVEAPLDGSFENWQQTVSPEQADRIRGLISTRLSSRQPLAYLLGSAWFAGLEFVVNDSVLVPRSPIAELILDRYSPWLKPGQLHRVLDLCTGCGCIAIANAVYLPGIRVDAVDISSSALEVAKLNVERHGVADQVQLIQSDLFAELAGQEYDLIVTNPPYVADFQRSNLPAEYQAEPELGLYSGEDGLDLCLRIMLQSPHHLAEDGILICEVGESADRLSAVLPAVPFLWLEFHSGGEGIFLLGKDVLLQSASHIEALIEERSRVR